MLQGRCVNLGLSLTFLPLYEVEPFFSRSVGRLDGKISQWELLHRPSLSLIHFAVFKDKIRWSDKTPNLGIFLKLVGNGPEYDHRSFVIDKVALIPWGLRQGGAHVDTGVCLLPDGGMSSQQSFPDYFYGDSGTCLPPGFDLHRFITHVNRGITHFHGSFWPLPRKLSDADFEAAKPSERWLRYMRIRPEGFEFQGYNGVVSYVFGVVKRNGKRVPLYGYDVDVFCVSFDSRIKALAKVDPTEFKKLLDDPGRKLCMVPKPLAQESGKSISEHFVVVGEKVYCRPEEY
ncbi:hypothetical protein B0H16DRAFT_1492099 [Mycena metata]|uniref:Uncharacterized protein n=1 Tax=Mycena metata TaxID=1033252 RepID=A0AAD7KF76_9AGAR|nr:hypothetical protein B0H16DRAFT_1492099 [Mycena metata]